MPVLRFSQDTPFPTLTFKCMFVKDWQKVWQKKKLIIISLLAGTGNRRLKKTGRKRK
jgi:hypothetical protein